ncbi:hypothetical protein RGB73_02520 [Brevibacillus brevis]|uniref:Uncharacterized protein n=1 Tax=Brevibacillus brevis TaxID=1393 RepID=A0ABY9T5B7_BREBE|nr:hypothetical protein [Brevibacillus brevis]WNC15270.1 hypothetical protein RGB73_02520 [Brevibacillus brevis]
MPLYFHPFEEKRRNNPDHSREQDERKALLRACPLASMLAGKLVQSVRLSGHHDHGDSDHQHTVECDIRASEEAVVTFE